MRYIKFLYLKYFLRKLPKTVEICLKRSRPGGSFLAPVYILVWYWPEITVKWFNFFIYQDLKDTCVHSHKKVLVRSRFFESNFDGFGQFSQKVLRIQKCYIPHWKALISSIQNLYRKGVWPLQQSSYAHLIENDQVLLKGAWQVCWKGHAPCW